MRARIPRRPTRAAVAKALRQLEVLWRMPEKDKPGARGNEQTGPDTTEHFTLDFTPARAKRGAA